MSTEQIIRAWKDDRYRQSLSAAEQELVPAHPAGTIELTASELINISNEDNQEGFLDTYTCTHCSDPVMLDLE